MLAKETETLWGGGGYKEQDENKTLRRSSEQEERHTLSSESKRGRGPFAVSVYS